MVLFPLKTKLQDHPRPIYARSGWEIPQPPPIEVHEASNELGDAARETRRTIELLHPNKRQSLSIRSVPKHLYSCVGMAFASRRAWIDPDCLYDILRHDGYTKVSGQLPLCRGDIALYCMKGKPVHVGLVTQVDRNDKRVFGVRVLSKWGRVGEIEHPLHNVPDFCGEFHSYWTERTPPSD